MGISPHVFSFFITLYNKGFFNNLNSIMELGSQDFGGDPQDILFFLKSIGKDTSLLSKTYDNQGGITIKELIKKSCSFSGKVFYEWLGFKNYECIDSDGKWNAKIFDLNLDLKEKYNYDLQFDVTTNFGTSEHVFNQLMFFKNMHNLTKENGYMIHYVPFKIYQSHCLYHYTTSFFTSLAYYNKYKLVTQWVLLNEKKPTLEIDDKTLGKMYNDREITNIIALYVFQKTSSEEFKIPFQIDSIYFDNNKLGTYGTTRNIKKSAVNVIRKIVNKKINSKLLYPKKNTKSFVD